MSFTTSNSQILVAGCQKSMFTIDVEKGQIIEKACKEPI
jgi:PAB-dependent poly(A)-specific ribonuclease subunit 2